MSELEKRADSLKTYVVNQHFIPVDFYASRPIDYKQDDTDTTRVTDLRPYILPYLLDDTITFQPNGILDLDQGDSLYPVPPNPPLEPPFYWEVGTIKAKNEVFFLYLDYLYTPKRYTLDYFTDTAILAHVPWESKINATDTATLYTRFRKK